MGCCEGRLDGIQVGMLDGCDEGRVDGWEVGLVGNDVSWVGGR